MLRQHSIPHIVQTAAGKFRLSGTGMLAVPSASFTPTFNLFIYMSARSFRIFGTAVHFYSDFSGRRAALACSCEGGKSGNPMPLRFPSGYPQRFNILSGGHSLNAPRVHQADTVQSSPTRAPHFMRIVTIRGPAFSQNLIGEQVRSRISEDSLGSLIRKNGSAGLFILSHSGECATPANFTRTTPEPPQRPCRIETLQRRLRYLSLRYGIRLCAALAVPFATNHYPDLRLIPVGPFWKQEHGYNWKMARYDSEN